jgi:hypothetical protein
MADFYRFFPLLPNKEFHSVVKGKCNTPSGAFLQINLLRK